MNRIRQVAALIATSFAVSGCGLLGPALPQPSSPSADYDAVAKNLVDAIAQYPQFNRMLANVEKSPAGTAFEQQVYVEMEERGYNLAEQDSGATTNIVDAAVRRVTKSGPDGSDENAPLYVLSIGDVSVERRFRQDDGVTLPVSELVIRGAEQRTITLNDELVFTGFDPEISDVIFLSQSADAIGSELQAGSRAGVQASQQDEPVVSAAVPANAVVATTSENDATQQLAATRNEEVTPAIHQNIYETLESNYMEVLQDYEDVEQNVLVFPNDSLRMGDTNKEMIEHYVEMMDPRTDILSVIGCSHGDTEISNGNALLALGRAHRVKEAFLFSGIHHSQVFDEGCWAPEQFDEMPARGVVLTLKRLKDA